MTATPQSDVIAFLADPATHGGGAVERIDTHGAVVFLAGERAYKLKRAVRFDYMDFSTLALRDAATAAELVVNRRTADELYLGRRAIVRGADGRLGFDGPGEVLDWVVEMRRFDQDALLDRVAARGGLGPDLLARLVAEVARFHAGAERSTAHGGAAALLRVIDGNRTAMADCPLAAVAQAAPDLHAASMARLERVRALLEARRAGGFVRHCHGDLHLGNICLIDGRPVLFDAIEFNPALAWIDVLYDVAFLLMDLRHRGLAEAASTVLNRYADAAPTPDALAALPLFLSLRAAIRAHTAAAAAAAQPAAQPARALEAAAGAYLAAAVAYLAPPPPRRAPRHRRRGGGGRRALHRPVAGGAGGGAGGAGGGAHGRCVGCRCAGGARATRL